MAENAFINKVIYGGNSIIDLTQDTISANKVLNGTIFHLPSGEIVETASSASPATEGNPRKVVGIPSKSAETFHPTANNDQTINGDQYLNGIQTIRKVTIANLEAGNVKYGTQINIGDVDDIDRIASITGSFTGDANAEDSEILYGVSAYTKGVKITGSMPNNGSVSGTISTKDEQYTVPQGYHDGSGKVGILSSEKTKIIAENIKAGVQILGVTGTYSGEVISVQSKSVTPYTTAQTVLPDAGYDYLSQVTVAAIAYVETDNAAGGKTVTIGTVAP